MNNDSELKVKQVFESLVQEDFGPHPFLKTRVLATSRELIKSRQKIFYWKLVSGLSMACLVISLAFNAKTTPANGIALNEPYVIHMTFSDEEVKFVAAAEIELPTGVKFHSLKNPQINKMRKLRLPVSVDKDGRTKLPFVVVANDKGYKKIQVRLFDSDNNVLKEDVIKVRFLSKKS
jgi:hypothetical protein